MVSTPSSVAFSIIHSYRSNLKARQTAAPLRREAPPAALQSREGDHRLAGHFDFRHKHAPVVRDLITLSNLRAQHPNKMFSVSAGELSLSSADLGKQRNVFEPYR